MARYDKVEPNGGSFRAVLDADLGGANVGVPLGVGLTANGRIVLGAGNTGVLGVLVIDSPKVAGDVLDVMTDGEIVDVDGLTAGTVYHSTPAGAVTATATGNTRLGHTVEAWRLVVRAAR